MEVLLEHLIYTKLMYFLCKIT